MAIEFEIINRAVTPAGGWRYTQPESGKLFVHHDYKTWKEQIRSHRKANGYPIPDDFEEALLDEACKQNIHWTQQTCKRVMNHRPIRRRKPGFKEALAFLNVLKSFIQAGGHYVEQEEADRRAELCARCPNNRPLEFGCGACVSSIRSVLGWLIGKDRKTWADHELNSCTICGCNLKAAVWFPLASQKAGLTDEQIAELNSVAHCWKKYP